jgi:organic radical activating enzyme
MRAQNLTISVPYEGCDKNCPYCVSKMTGYPKSSHTLMARNINKVKRLAHAAQVTSVLITGKGEPCMDRELLQSIVSEFKAYPVELQTNGCILSVTRAHLHSPTSNEDAVARLFRAGLNVLALSLDVLEDFRSFNDLLSHAREVGLVTRVTLNLTDMIPADTPLRTVLDLCEENCVDQLTFRKITTPNYIVDTKEAYEAKRWIASHTNDEQFDRMMWEVKELGHHVVRNLPYGAVVYDIDGIAVTGFDYCVQDTNNNEDIRSLIFMEDGHVYTSWNSKASILF